MKCQGNPWMSIASGRVLLDLAGPLLDLQDEVLFQVPGHNQEMTQPASILSHVIKHGCRKSPNSVCSFAAGTSSGWIWVAFRPWLSCLLTRGSNMWQWVKICQRYATRDDLFERETRALSTRAWADILSRLIFVVRSFRSFPTSGKTHAIKHHKPI